MEEISFAMYETTTTPVLNERQDGQFEPDATRYQTDRAQVFDRLVQGY